MIEGMKRGVLFSIGGVLAAAVIIGGTAYFVSDRSKSVTHHCDFPASVREKSGDRKLYCPDSKSLPSGVVSKTGEATYGRGAVVYSIVDGTSTIAVSLQTKPDKEHLANFVPNIIPLHFDVETPIGKAQVGVSGNSFITSLPTSSTTWILVTGPKDYSLDKLTPILKTFRQD
jgi:hypothetical protein